MKSESGGFARNTFQRFIKGLIVCKLESQIGANPEVFLRKKEKGSNSKNHILEKNQS